MLRDPSYRRHFAAADPFFAENIEPFAHEVPLMVVGRSGDIGANGLPSRREQCALLTAPKVNQLREWGWRVEFLEPSVDAGTSFSMGTAQQWVLDKLNQFLV